MSSSSSPCAACKFLRRKCTQECVFAPYFPPDNPQRFTCVHRVFGASNVAKILNELSPSQREEAVNSLAFEADARLRNPIYGCVATISFLQQRLRQIQNELHMAKNELVTYIGPQAAQSLLNPASMNPGTSRNPYMSAAVYPYGMSAHGGQLMIRDAQRQQQEIMEAQHPALAAAAETAQQQYMIRNLEQQHQEFMRHNGGFEHGGSVGAAVGGVGCSEFGNQIGSSSGTGQGEMVPQLGLGTSLEAQLLFSPHQQAPQTYQQYPGHQQQLESEEGRSVLVD